MSRIAKKGILWGAVLTMLLFTACSKEQTTPSNVSDIKTEQTVVVEEFYPFGENCTVSGTARLGSRLLLCGENGNGKVMLGIVDWMVEDNNKITFSDVQVLRLDETDAADESNFYGVCAGGNGFFYVLTGELPGTYKNPNFEIGDALWLENSDYEGRYSILKYSKTGELLERIKIQNWPHSGINGIAVGNEGEIVLYDAGYIALTDRTGAIIHEETAGEGLYVQSVSNSDQGLIASLHETSKLQGTYYRIDSQSGLLTQLNRPGLDELYTLDTGSASVTQGLNGEYILYDSIGLNKLDSEYRYRGLYAIDFEGETYRELYRLGKVGEPENCTYICLLTEDVFVYTHVDSAALYFAKRGERSQAISEGRSLVKVAAYGNNTDEIQAQLSAINTAGGDYFYECTTYNANQLDLLMTEISAGNAPDLVLFPAILYNGEPLDTNSEYFEDLYSYLDSDPELSRESFIPNLLEALSVDGKLTSLNQYVQIYSIIVRTSDIGNRKTLVPEDYMKLLNENEEYTSVQPPWMSKESLLSWVATLSCSVYIDKNTVSCHFDDGNFSELLQWVKDVGSDYKDGDPLPEFNYAEYASGISQITTAFRIHGDKSIFGEPVTYVGFPIGDVPGNIYYCDGTCMAIPAFADNKDGAWAYIRNQLSCEALYSAQEENTQAQNKFPKIPVNLEAAKQLASLVLTEGEVQELIDLMSATKYVKNNHDDALYKIILTCGQAYLAGDKTLEDTVTQIQSRTSVYVAEKYG